MLQSVIVPNRRGKPLDVALGYDDLSSYEAGSCCYGATIGRFANRIGGGRFVLDGREYLLEKNSEENRNHIHGVFAKRIFEAFEKDGRLLLKYFSPDMEEGYPGNLELTVGFQITGDNALEIEYTAATDAPTVINLSNHCYFNLNGPDASTVLNHRVWLNSSHYTEYTEDFLAPQAKPFYDKLQSLGVPSEYRCYGDSEKEPAHVFHINIKLPVAGKCNDEQCAFFKRLTEV